MYDTNAKKHKNICQTFRVEAKNHFIGEITAEHEGFEFGIVTGALPYKMRVRNKMHTLKGKQALIYNALEKHTEIYDGTDHELFAVVIEKDFANRVFQGIDLKFNEIIFDKVLVRSDIIQSTLNELYACRLYLEDYDVSFDCLTSELLVETLVNVPHSHSRRIQNAISQGYFPHFVERAKRILQDRLSTDTPSIVELCVELGVSQFHLIRIFKKTTGLSPYQYLNRLRLEKACTLLRVSKKTILEVAHQVGVLDISNFNYYFKRMTGVSPLKYRKMRLS